MKLLAFTWNTQSAEFGPDAPDFLGPLLARVTSSDADIVSLCLQEDAWPAAAAVTIVVPERFAQQGYAAVAIETLIGVGATSWKALVNDWKPQARGLRTMVFAKKCLVESGDVCAIKQWSQISRDDQAPWYNRWWTYLTRGKGSCSVLLNVRGSRLLLSNVHLPFDAKSLDEPGCPSAARKRPVALARQTQLFNLVIKGIVAESCAVDAWILCGDLNYRVEPMPLDVFASRLREDAQRLIADCDELAQELGTNKVAVPWLEGVTDHGPGFGPTAKRAVGCSATSRNTWMQFNVGKAKQRMPSWCDRVLYHSRNPQSVVCLGYERMDDPEFECSDHFPAAAVFDV